MWMKSLVAAVVVASAADGGAFPFGFAKVLEDQIYYLKFYSE